MRRMETNPQHWRHGITVQRTDAKIDGCDKADEAGTVGPTETSIGLGLLGSVPTVDSSGSGFSIAVASALRETLPLPLRKREERNPNFVWTHAAPAGKRGLLHANAPSLPIGERFWAIRVKLYCLYRLYRPKVRPPCSTFLPSSPFFWIR